MANAMTKSQIVEYLAKKADIKKTQLPLFLMSSQSSLARKQKTHSLFRAFGKIVLVQRKARVGRNPQTGAAIKIPAKKVVKFRVAKAAKDAIIGKE